MKQQSCFFFSEAASFLDKKKQRCFVLASLKEKAKETSFAFFVAAKLQNSHLFYSKVPDLSFFFFLPSIAFGNKI